MKVFIHRRDAEDAEATQRKPKRISLRNLCALRASVVRLGISYA